MYGQVDRCCIRTSMAHVVIAGGGLDATPQQFGNSYSDPQLGLGTKPMLEPPEPELGITITSIVSYCRVAVSDMACRTVQVLYRATVLQINETNAMSQTDNWSVARLLTQKYRMYHRSVRTEFVGCRQTRKHVDSIDNVLTKSPTWTRKSGICGWQLSEVCYRQLLSSSITDSISLPPSSYSLRLSDTELSDCCSRNAWRCGGMNRTTSVRCACLLVCCHITE